MATAAKKKDVRPTSMNLSREQLSNVNFKNVSAHSIEADIVAAEYWKADNYGSRRNQYVCALIASLGSVCMGCCLGWSSPALPYLEGEGNSKFAITKEESSWIGSLLTLGAVVGALPTGYMVDTIGRKLVQIIISILYILSWVILLAIEESLHAIYLARIICGIASGALTVVLPLYNEEISQTAIRGRTGCFLYLMLSVGVSYIYIVGTNSSYLWLNVGGAVMSVVYFTTMTCMPESPAYLISKLNFVEAEKALSWLRRADLSLQPRVVKEIFDLHMFTNASKIPMKRFSNCFRRMWEYFRYHSSKASIIRKVVFLMNFHQLCGINALAFSLNRLIITSHTERSSVVGMFSYVPIGPILAVLLTIIVVDKVGRRWLIMTSLAGLLICLVILIIEEVALEGDSPLLTRITLICLLLCIGFYSIGMGPLPWVIMAELLTADLKKVVTPTAVSINWTVGFAVSKFFPLLVESFTEKWAYVIFCFVCIIGLIYVPICIPETKGKSQMEVLINLESAFFKRIKSGIDKVAKTNKLGVNRLV